VDRNENPLYCIRSINVRMYKSWKLQIMKKAMGGDYKKGRKLDQG
jgi:hypothetical protein